MSDDSRGEGVIEADSPAQAPDCTQFDFSRQSIAERLAALQAIEEALSRSSSKLSQLLSSLPGEWHPEPTAANDDAVAAWVAPDASAPPGLGRIMLSRQQFMQSALAGALDAESPRLTSNVAVASGHAANDNALWLGSEDGADGIFGREPSAAVLPDGKTVIAWIGEDNIVHAALHPDEQKQQAEAVAGDTLSQMLGSLGEASPAHGRDAGRLKVQLLTPSSFAVVWLAELGAASALAGKLFTLSADANEDGPAHLQSAAQTWAVASISPVPVRGTEAGDITIAASGGGELTLGYVSSDDAGHRASHSAGVALVGETQHAAEALPSTAGDHPGSDAVTGPFHHHENGHMAMAAPAPEPEHEASASEHVGSSRTPGPVRVAQLEKHADTATVTDVSQLVAVGADPLALARQFQNIAVTDDARIHVLEVGAGSPSGTALLSITTLDASGNPALDAGGHPEVISVTADAVVADPEHPGLDLTPVATSIGNSVGVSWVQQSAAHPGATEVAVQVYGTDGHALSSSPVVAGVSGSTGSVSDIDIAGLRQPADATHDAASAGAQAADVAVTWIENADHHGYGAVKLQLFDVQQSGGNSSGNAHAITALGADAQPGGDDDQAFSVTEDATAVGRDPQVEGVRGGAIAVAWVAPPVSPAQSPVISGVVIDGHNGHQLVALNLTVFMAHGVAEDYAPQLFTSPNGDIVIGWVEHSGQGYDAQAAVYSYVADGSWSSPTSALHLAHFDNDPDFLSIDLAGNEDPRLIVTWSDNGQSGRISIDIGDGEGSTVTAGSGCPSEHSADAHNLDDNAAGSAEALANAQFVVVYAQGDHGAPDLNAVAFSADGSSSSASDLRQTVDNLPLDTASAAAVATIIGLVSGHQDTPGQDVGLPADGAVAEADIAGDVITLLQAGASPAAPEAAGLPLTVSDLATTIDAYVSASSHTASAQDATDAAAASVAAGNDNFDFSAMPPALAADDAIFHQPAGTSDTIASAFDALHLANALNLDANGDVIVFDTSNVVTIKSLTTTLTPDSVI